MKYNSAKDLIIKLSNFVTVNLNNKLSEENREKIEKSLADIKSILNYDNIKNYVRVKEILNNDRLEKIEDEIKNFKDNQENQIDKYLNQIERNIVKVFKVLENLICNYSEEIMINFFSFILFDKDCFLSDIKTIRTFLRSKEVSIKDLLPEETNSKYTKLLKNICYILYQFGEEELDKQLKLLRKPNWESTGLNIDIKDIVYIMIKSNPEIESLLEVQKEIHDLRVENDVLCYLYEQCEYIIGLDSFSSEII